MRTQPLAIGPACAALLGCASQPTALTAGFSYLDSRELIYDELVLDIVEPGIDVPMEVALQTRGDGARDGLKMMLQAPAGCAEAGPIAMTFCIGLMPFIPFIAAGAVQDVATSRAELDVMAEQIDQATLQRRFRDAIETEARDAGLPLVESASPGARVATLHAELGQTRLEHDGYKHGDITVTQPYRFSLSYADNELQSVFENENWDRFYVGDGYIKNNAELAEDFDRWIADAAKGGLQNTVIEWQPKVVLGPIAPIETVERNAIGFKRHVLPVVESTTPRLTWQPLETALDPVVLAHVTDVTYELEILRVDDRRIITGLERPEYVVDEPLHACVHYHWRPVARFRYRGVVHTTSLSMRRWSKTQYLHDDFEFQTPAPDCENPWPTWYQKKPSVEPSASQPASAPDTAP